MRLFDNILSTIPGTTARRQREVFKLAAQFAEQVKKKRTFLLS